MKHKIIISNFDDINNPDYGGGGAVSIHQIARRLSTRYSIKVYTGKYPGSCDSIINGVRYVRLGTNIFGPKFNQLLFHILIIHRVMIEKFDVWIESFTPPISTSCLQLFTKRPVIGLVHMLSAADMQRKYKLPFKMVENLGLRTYRYLIVTTDCLKKQIRMHNPSAMIKIIGNGIDNNYLNLVNICKGQYILFIGRLELNQKGIDLLLNAYKQIGNCKMPLVIAGRGSSKQKFIIEKLIQRLGLENQVKLIGHVTGPLKKSIISKAATVVVPSRFESFSMVTLEALALGKPVVIFDLPNLKWIPSKHVYKAQPFNVDHLARQINKSLHRSMEKTKQQRSFAAQFTWKNQTDRYFRLLNNILITSP